MYAASVPCPGAGTDALSRSRAKLITLPTAVQGAGSRELGAPAALACWCSRVCLWELEEGFLRGEHLMGLVWGTRLPVLALQVPHHLWMVCSSRLLILCLIPWKGAVSPLLSVLPKVVSEHW